jgi:hypothetical protein
LKACKFLKGKIIADTSKKSFAFKIFGTKKLFSLKVLQNYYGIYEILSKIHVTFLFFFFLPLHYLDHGKIIQVFFLISFAGHENVW